MSISEEQVRHIARLAHLDLTESERAAMAADLNAILHMAARIRDDGGGGDAVGAPAEGQSAGGPGAESTPVRDDAVEPWPAPERALEEAPERRGDLFRVPPALGG
jgi:aspartyl-tRNA(Asn)/glutamyl-tRNA(Gln) amidotransferase subunit C